MLRHVALCLATLTLGAPAWAGELAGVALPDSLKVSGGELVLNGMGLRKKAVFKVYVGALYLEARSSEPAAIQAAEAPRRMVMHFLRSVGKTAITDGWREGFANNSPGTLPALQQRLDSFCDLWTDLENGDEAVMTYIPGVGTRVEMKGREVGLVQGKDFADALLRVWIGNKPPSADLKRGVLGQ